MKPLCLLTLIPWCISWASAQGTAPAEGTAAAKPSVIQLDDARYQIGDVIFNRTNREIRFPAKINMSAGVIEYTVLLQKSNKIHEGLLVTGVSPTHLNIAFKLLRYSPSPELNSEIDESGHSTGVYPDVPLPVKASARIAIEVEWTDQGTTHRHTLNECFQSGTTQKPMDVGPWLYTGSALSEDVYIPEITGNLFSIQKDGYAMINYPGGDNTEDPKWSPTQKLVPPGGTDVTVIISPFFKRKNLPTP